MHAIRNVLQPLGSVIDGVESGHVGKQCLSCADVAGGLVFPDLLLSRLQTQSVGRHRLMVPVMYIHKKQCVNRQ